MSGITNSVLMIVAMAGTIAISALFVFFGIRTPTRQGKLTCFVVAAMLLLPLVFMVMLMNVLQQT